MKVIVPLRPNSLSDALAKMRAVSRHADIVEIWLDGICELNEKKIQQIVKAARKPLILNLKDKAEKGSFTGGERKRVELLAAGAQAGAEFVDLPLTLPSNFIRAFRKQFPHTKLILSWHDFSAMPKIDVLRRLAKKAVALRADVVKLVGTAKNWSDVIPILALTRELATQKIPCLTMAMREKGEITRILAPLLGSLGMFAPIEKKSASASGQLTARELKNWWKVFG